jgi:hypothetical protein
MKLTNGTFLIYTGITHIILGISPYAFGNQFLRFSENYFFRISEGLSEFPLLNGVMNYENFASFWFVYFGALFIPLGILLDYVEKNNHIIPKKFLWSYFIFNIIGAYMIPFSGMTFLTVPHSIFMLIKNRKKT